MHTHICTLSLFRPRGGIWNWKLSWQMQTLIANIMSADDLPIQADRASGVTILVSFPGVERLKYKKTIGRDVLSVRAKVAVVRNEILLHADSVVHLCTVQKGLDLNTMHWNSREMTFPQLNENTILHWPKQYACTKKTVSMFRRSVSLKKHEQLVVYDARAGCISRNMHAGARLNIMISYYQ